MTTGVRRVKVGWHMYNFLHKTFRLSLNISRFQEICKQFYNLSGYKLFKIIIIQMSN